MKENCEFRMDLETIKETIRQTAKEAVKETLMSLGLTVDDPSEIQQDMAHLRKSRKGCEAVKSNIMKTIITVTIPSVLYLLWEVFIEVIKK